MHTKATEEPEEAHLEFRAKKTKVHTILPAQIKFPSPVTASKAINNPLHNLCINTQG